METTSFLETVWPWLMPEKNMGVYQESLSLLVSHKGIMFSESGRKVELLFCFSSKGVRDYIELFNEIVKNGQDEEFRNCLLEMSEEELYQTLCYKAS